MLFGTCEWEIRGGIATGRRVLAVGDQRLQRGEIGLRQSLDGLGLTATGAKDATGEQPLMLTQLAKIQQTLDQISKAISPATHAAANQ